MATRNRTATFVKYREAVRQSKPLQSSIELNDLGTRKLLSGGASTSTKGGYNSISTNDSDGFRPGVAASLPPAWVDVSEDITSEMGRVRARMAELAKAHARALMPTFQDTGEDTQNIDALTQEITRSLKKCEQKLQRLAARDYATSEDTKIRKNVQRSVATDLQALSMEFRKQQKGYLQKLQRQHDSSGGGSLGLEKTKSADEDFYDPGFDGQQMARLNNSEAMSAEREKEIAQIVDSVNELAGIMKDLSALVIDQGTIVDRIDYNIENVSVSVEKGVQQLVKAEQHQKKGRMVLCIMLLMVMCLLMIVVLVLKKVAGAFIF